MMEKKFVLADDQLEAVTGGLLDEVAEVVKSEPEPLKKPEENSLSVGAITVE